MEKQKIVTCEVVTKTRLTVRKTGGLRESLEKCGRTGRIFVVLKRSGLAPVHTKMCVRHARAMGNKWLVFTLEYWNARPK